MNSHTHKLFFVVLLSVPAVALSSAPQEYPGDEQSIVYPLVYPLTKRTAICPLPALPVNSSRLSQQELDTLKALLATQQQNAQRTAAAAVKAMTDLVKATEPAALPIDPIGPTQKESPKTNRK